MDRLLKRQVNRRTMMVGVAGAAALTTFGPRGFVRAQDATPGAMDAPFYDTIATAEPTTGSTSPFRIGVVPSENLEDTLSGLQPFTEYLREVLEADDLEYFPAVSYTSVIEAMRGGNIELGYFGPFSYILAYELANARSIAVPGIDGVAQGYTSSIVTTTETGITDLEGIRGNSIAFVDPASASGNLIPRTLLIEAGLEEDRDYQQIFAGGHDSALLALINGTVDVACLGTFAVESAVAQGLATEDDFVFLATSDNIPDGPWAVQTSMDPGLARRIQDAFFAFGDTVGVETFQETIYAPAEEFVPAPDEIYDPLRDVVTALNIDLEDLAG